MEIQGEKLLLIPVSDAHLDFVCQLECDANLWSFEESIKTDIDEVREEYLERMGEDCSYDFVITLASDSTRTPIGIAQLWSYVEHRNSWELGFAVLPGYSGRGYGKEAAGLLLKFAFEELNAHKVVGMCNCNNTPSAVLMERIGMRREAVFKDEYLWHGDWTDQYFYSILDKEFVER
ncbi:GNAT family N-acetyltransferase [Paenibacillus sp. J22TS3]|uniref:GNAT family N-acetyltransferase n=1 Tax=Paenibacillus sp. J22TS3 TaxID=2807192 RepID=UPI001B2E454B|nr:GNAT family protein [Paenibacillus sp. J22TS3]GIP24665.1 hypothetical protein J22TS3_49400 [Paenibacillus sp. J22TS3]